MRHLDESYFKNADIETEDEVEEIEQQSEDYSSYKHTMIVPVLRVHSCHNINTGEELDERLSLIKYRINEIINKFVFINKVSEPVFIGNKKCLNDVLTG